ncbi:hypothetical protein GJ496_000597 [Pomphorhynchus laevis]|nr:hypothetical protein GJ496_000597 [Pomphorhynchus laevis]
MRDGTWVLGLIEDNKDCRLKICEDNLRNSSSLVPFIVDNVNIGTTIHTDLRDVYSLLGQLEFVHDTKTTDELEYVYILPTKLGGLEFRDPMVEVLNQHSSSIQMYIPFDTALANDREQS